MNENTLKEGDLYRLIEQWEARADEAREQTRLAHASDLSRVTFNQGVLQTYQNAIRDLRDLLAAAPAPPVDTPQYLATSEADAHAVLQRAGLFTRSLTLHPDRVFTAVFSRLQPITLENRLRQLRAADARLVIVNSGTLRDTGDPYIDFAFVDS